nr:MAG TPA: hypothetical protein [Crassvirales sp.]
MSKLINLIEKLRFRSKGTKLYSPLFGEVEYVGIRNNQIIVHTDYYRGKEQMTDEQAFNKYGKYLTIYDNAECLLFPSKDNHDWNTFPTIEERQLVMCSNNGINWELKSYYKDRIVKNIDLTEEYNFIYIVPIEKFDFNIHTISFNINSSI